MWRSSTRAGASPPRTWAASKANSSRAANAVRGSGIGLALVDSIMTALDGTLDLRSTLGKGTVITLGLLCIKNCNPAPGARGRGRTQEKKEPMNHQAKKECFKTSVGGQGPDGGHHDAGAKADLLRRPPPRREHRDQDRPHPHPQKLDEDPHRAGGCLDDREPCGGLPVHDVLGPGQHGGGLRRGRRGDRL